MQRSRDDAGRQHRLAVLTRGGVLADRKAFLLRLDPETHAQLERWAADELRSTNGQIEYLLRRALAEAGRLRPRAGGGAKRESER